PAVAGPDVSGRGPGRGDHWQAAPRPDRHGPTALQCRADQIREPGSCRLYAGAHIMSGRPWHKRFHSDALSGYLDLTLEERGAYTTLLDMLYDRREPIVENERLLAGYLGVSVRKARSVIDALIAKGKI